MQTDNCCGCLSLGFLECRFSLGEWTSCLDMGIKWRFEMAWYCLFQLNSVVLPFLAECNKKILKLISYQSYIGWLLSGSFLIWFFQNSYQNWTKKLGALLPTLGLHMNISDHSSQQFASLIPFVDIIWLGEFDLLWDF